MPFNSWLQLGRFVVQATALVITVVGAYALIKGMGVPKWAFYTIVIMGGMFFCGWLCPFGTIQEWLYHVGQSTIGYSLKIPPRIDRLLSYSRYLVLIVLGVFAIEIYEPRLAFSGYFSGKSAEVGAYAMLGGFLLLALFMERPFCRYLCGFGAHYGLLSIIRLFSVKRDSAKCVKCKKCDARCLMGVRVSSTAVVRHPHCINCFKCISTCPVSGALAYGMAFPRLPDVVRRKPGLPL